ncbi:hypothetical protein YC2023_094663 [Brassica napus]
MHQMKAAPLIILKVVFCQIWLMQWQNQVSSAKSGVFTINLTFFCGGQVAEDTFNIELVLEMKYARIKIDK